MKRKSLLLLVALSTSMIGCQGDDVTREEPVGADGSFLLVSENDDALPADPSAPFGCCITLSGAFWISGNEYSVTASYQNKNNGLLFENNEHGTVTRNGNTISFTRVGGGGIGYPFLFAPTTLSGGNKSLTLLYGDEGPGSNQIKAVFNRLPELPH